MHVDLMVRNGNTTDEIIDAVFDRCNLMLAAAEIDNYNKYLFNLTDTTDAEYMRYLGKLDSHQERAIKFGLANQDMEVIDFKLGKVGEITPDQDAYMANAAYNAFRYEMNEYGYKASHDRLTKLVKIRSDAIKNYQLNGGSADNSIIEFMKTGAENQYIKNDAKESIHDMIDVTNVHKQKADQQGVALGGVSEDEDEDDGTGTEG